MRSTLNPIFIQTKYIRSWKMKHWWVASFTVLPQTLDFSNCLISHIDRKAFSTLGNSVEAIVLKGNLLSSLQVIEVKTGMFCIFLLPVHHYLSNPSPIIYLYSSELMLKLFVWLWWYRKTYFSQQPTSKVWSCTRTPGDVTVIWSSSGEQREN